MYGMALHSDPWGIFSVWGAHPPAAEGSHLPSSLLNDPSEAGAPHPEVPWSCTTFRNSYPISDLRRVYKSPRPCLWAGQTLGCN